MISVTAYSLNCFGATCKSLTVQEESKTKCFRMSEDSSDESYRLEGIVFGLDGRFITCLGWIIVFSRLLQILVFVMVTEIIGGFANAFGNSIGFFIPQSSERAL